MNKLKAKTLSQFRFRKSLLSKVPAVAPLLKQFLDEALKAEKEVHFGVQE